MANRPNDETSMKINRHVIFVGVVFFSFCTLILALTLRGLPGNPSADELNSTTWRDHGPLELSPERGRYALTYSIVEDHSLEFSLPVARFATPDLGMHNGKFVSLFAPGISYLVIPGYVIGRYFGAAQMGTFAVIAIFALLNAALIWLIAMRLGANRYAGAAAAAVFLFATPAFAYGVSLYQHHVSVFFILASLYILLRWRGLPSLALVWLLCAASIPVDYPNAILLFPVGLYALSRIVWFRKEPQGLRISFRFLGIFTFITALIPLAFFLWFNHASFGNALQLSGTVQAVKAIDENGSPYNPEQITDPELVTKKSPPGEKTAVGFFKTRNILNGFYTHLFSADRGMIRFTPVMIFGIIGLILMLRRRVPLYSILIAIVGANVLLYSMWGDPYGGWAFGSRYLIPSYAILSIGIAILLTEWKKEYILLAVFSFFAFSSVWINSLGAITSSKNPPRVEVLALEKLSGHEEKFSYDRNELFLQTDGSKSFVYQTAFKDEMSPRTYHRLINYLIDGLILFLLATLFFDRPTYKKSDEQ